MEQTQTNKITVHHILEVIGEKIDRWTEFVITVREVSVSEFGVFLFATMRCVWLYYYADRFLNCPDCGGAASLWFLAFIMVAVSHLLAVLFTRKPVFRSGVCLIHAFLSGVMCVFALYQAPASGLAPFSFTVLIIAALTAVKLYRHNAT